MYKPWDYSSALYKKKKRRGEERKDKESRGEGKEKVKKDILMLAV